MPVLAEFNDPRLAAVYDSVNPYGEDARFYIELARDLGVTSIVDLGCGTGQITCELALQGYRVTGVDPSPAMLCVARQRPGSERVRWIGGDASRIGTPAADLAIMTAHVAQFFLGDQDWLETLDALRAALRPGGWLAFESRDPRARAWERWTPATRTTVDDPIAGKIETWIVPGEVEGDTVSYTIHYWFAETGETLTSENRLRFRTEGELRQSLVRAGFVVERTYGDWDRRPVGADTPEIIVVAGRLD